MRIPSELKIGTQTVQVIQKPLVEIDSNCSGGWAMWEHNKLIIANDVPQDRKEQIFIHEILHFINVYLEEEEVTYLAESIYQVFKDNNLMAKSMSVAGSKKTKMSPAKKGQPSAKDKVPARYNLSTKGKKAKKVKVKR